MDYQRYRRSKLSGCIILLVNVVGWVLALGQSGICSSILAIFDQDNQTYRWDNSLDYIYAPKSQFSFALEGKMQSTLIKKSLISGGPTSGRKIAAGGGS